MTHHRCGNHMSVALDQSLQRKVEHETFICHDCAAIDLARKRWHASQGHPKSGPCPCDDEVFYIAERTPHGIDLTT